MEELQLLEALERADVDDVRVLDTQLLELLALGERCTPGSISVRRSGFFRGREPGAEDFARTVRDLNGRL